MLRILLTVFSVLLSAVYISADNYGTVLWPRSSDHEQNAYARVIELQHAGSDNGKLLATWEHWFDDKTPGGFVIRQSSDDGETWDTITTLYDTQTSEAHPAVNFWQPFFFEYPQQLGNYPEGTILLVGNLVDSPTTYTQFYAWRSANHGQTWDIVGPWQNGAMDNGTFEGIWEPYLYLDKAGELVALFSDERNHTIHSQKLVHVTSIDGGDTWGPVIDDVASTTQSDRPGMGIVSLMDNGQYFMSYEICGRTDCPAHFKVSEDGSEWNAADTGTAVQTDDNLFLSSSPYSVWDPNTKSIFMGSWNVFYTDSLKLSPGTKRTLFINSNYGQGSWDWAPAPWSVERSSTDCDKASYSPDLLVQTDGNVRMTTASSQGSSGYCAENTGSAPIGSLPYMADFTSHGQAGWSDYGGTWTVSQGAYSAASSSANDSIALTGSTGWIDYTYSADVSISGSGAVGLISRVTNVGLGINAFDGYLASCNSQAGTFKIGKISGGQQYDLAQASVNYTAGASYQLSFSLSGSTLSAFLSGGDLSSNVTITADDGSYAKGLVGLLVRANVGGCFENIEVAEL